MALSGINIPRRTQWLVLLTVLLFFAGLVASTLYFERVRLTQEQQERLTTKARVIDENILRQFEGVANALRSVLGDLPILQDSPGLLSLRLKALSDAMPGVRTVNVLEASGRVLASNRDNLVGRDFSGRAYVAMVSQAPDPDVLYLSKPFETVLGVYSMNLMRVSMSGDGRLAHIVTATLDPEFFEVLLSSVRFAGDVWVALAHVEGQLALHFPDRPELLGTNLIQPGSLFSQHIDSGARSTFLSGTARTTGQKTWMAQRTISAPELNMRGALVVAVARSPDEALKQWWFLAWIGAGMVLAVSAVAALGLWRTHRTQDKTLEALAHEEALRLKAEEEVRQMAFYDHLTQLPNRRLLLDRLAQLMALSVRHGRYSALVFLDLDGFKLLNDQYGHDKGDRLLQAVAQRLQAELRQGDTAARWAGDEFVVMLAELSADADEAARRATVVAEKIRASLARDYDLDGLHYRCTASLGVTLFGGKEESLDGIIQRADRMMYEAKASGRNSIHGSWSLT